MLVPESDLADLLAAFRAEKRRILELGLAATHGPAARDAVVVMAAWLDEVNERIPSLLAGAPPVDYDRNAFADAALERGRQLDIAGALHRFRRAADRYETMAAELSPEEIAHEPDVRLLVELAAAFACSCRVQMDGVELSFETMEGEDGAHHPSGGGT
jgi:hypothetical protein